jgi:hypothetical protein
MRSGNDVNGFRMPFTTVFRTARLLLFQGQVLSCMTEALRRRQRQSLAFENRQHALALGWQGQSGQQDFLSWRHFLKRIAACWKLFSNYHGC